MKIRLVNNLSVDNKITEFELDTNNIELLDENGLRLGYISQTNNHVFDYVQIDISVVDRGIVGIPCVVGLQKYGFVHIYRVTTINYFYNGEYKTLLRVGETQ